MYKAAIFDLDGTLADSVKSIAYTANLTLEHFGLPAQEIKKYCYFAGDGAAVLIKRALIASGDTELNYYDRAYEYYKKIFQNHCMHEVTIFDGMKETLDELKAQGIKIAVLSNKPHERTEDVVFTLFKKGYFDIVHGLKEDGAKKPDPKGALEIADSFGVKPQECIYVGDTNVDMQTGKNADMYTVGVLWGFRDREELEENNADAIIEHPRELIQIVNENK